MFANSVEHCTLKSGTVFGGRSGAPADTERCSLDCQAAPLLDGEGLTRLDLFEALTEPHHVLECLQQEQREEAGERWQEQRDWKNLVFRRPRGAPISPSDDWRQWQEVTQTVLGRRARVHDARHSSAALMIDAGAPLTAVRDVLGHSRIDMTSRYVGTASEAAHDAIRAVTRSLSGRG